MSLPRWSPLDYRVSEEQFRSGLGAGGTLPLAFHPAQPLEHLLGGITMLALLGSCRPASGLSWTWRSLVPSEHRQGNIFSGRAMAWGLGQLRRWCEHMGLGEKNDPNLFGLPVLTVLINALNDLERLGLGSEDCA